MNIEELRKENELVNLFCSLAEIPSPSRKEEKVIDSYKLKNELTLTDSSVTYYDTDGNRYEYSF